MPPLLIHSPFVPPEWVEAHGFLPRRATAPQTGGCSACGEGLCAVAAGAMAQPGPAVFATTCDQLRRAHDEAADAFLLDVPAAWQSAAAQRLFRDELLRLGRWMVARGGHAPAGFADIARQQDRQRATQRGLVPEPDGRPRLAVLGGPLPAEIPGLVAEAGGQLALDASETGVRGLAPPLDLRLLGEDPLEAVAAAHLAIPDPTRRPDDGLHRWLADTCAARSIHGILLCADPWCDQWQMQEPRLRHHAPVLRLDAGDSAARTLTRIQAFCEMLA